MKVLKTLSVLLGLMALGLILTACGKQKNETTTTTSKPLSGVYKGEQDHDDGTEAPFYWAFRKDGTLIACVPDTDSYYGEAKRGTWKALKNGQYKINMHDVYDHDYYHLKAVLEGNTLYISDLSKKPAYKWGSNVTATLQKGVTYSEVKDMFNNASASDQSGIQENGYTKPDNASDRSSSDSSSSSNDNNADPDEIGRAIYSRVFPSEQVDSVEQDGDSYYVSNEYHSADSTIRFQINGDSVTYWTQGDGDSTADGQNEAHTISVSDLLGE